MFWDSVFSCFTSMFSSPLILEMFMLINFYCSAPVFPSENATGYEAETLSSWSMVRSLPGVLLELSVCCTVSDKHTHVCFLARTKSSLLRKHLALTRCLLQIFIIYCLRRSNFDFLLFDIHNLILWLLSFSFIFYLSCLFFLSYFFLPHFFLFFTHFMFCLGYPFLTKKSSLLNVFLVVMNYVRINFVCENLFFLI